MRLIRGLYNIKPQQQRCVATIGNFDGLHLGHREVIRRLLINAEQLGLPALVVTFEPHPAEYFQKGLAQLRLMKLREKLTVLKEWGVDQLLCLKFDKSLAEFSAEDFIQQVLLQQLKVEYLVAGEDFGFGINRSGSIDLLGKYAFNLEIVPDYWLAGVRVSSTRIRQVLQEDKLALAKQLLGREFGISGKVIHGSKRGRRLGVRTANINLHRHAVPLHGVYAVKVSGMDDAKLPGVANIGNNPTVQADKSLLEVHIFDFDAEIYGKFLYVEFLHKIREQKCFDNLAKLQAQIKADIAAGREYFKEYFKKP